MGTPAYTSAYVRFDTPQHASDAAMAFRKWARLANDGKLPEIKGGKPINGDYGISAIDAHDCEITYQVESGRYQNCIWQCQNILDFWKTQPGLEWVEQNIMTCEESVNWYKGDDDDNP